MKRARIIIFGILALMIVCFIFSNSAQPRSESIERSSVIVDILKPILDPHDRINDDVFHNLIRKAAHFTEFAALGFSLMGLSDGFAWKKSRRFRCILPLIAGGLDCSNGRDHSDICHKSRPGIFGCAA